jgi:hypothetical protein
MNEEEKKREYKIEYIGTWIGLNKIYGMNRYIASQHKREWKERFSAMLRDSGIKPLAAFKLHLQYNSRLDCDNTVAGLKLIVDTMRAEGYVMNDDKRFYKGFSVTPDYTLKHNTYVVTITEV